MIVTEALGYGQGWDVSRYSLDRARLEALFWLGVGLERHICGCRSVSRVEKIHFAYSNDTFYVSKGLETVSESVSKDTSLGVGNNLVKIKLKAYLSTIREKLIVICHHDPGGEGGVGLGT